jgi:hypothetical protein
MRCRSSQVVERVEDLVVHWRKEKGRCGRSLCLGALPVVVVQMEQGTFDSKVSEVSKDWPLGTDELEVLAVPQSYQHLDFLFRQYVLSIMLGSFRVLVVDLRSRIRIVCDF